MPTHRTLTAAALTLLLSGAHAQTNGNVLGLEQLAAPASTDATSAAAPGEKPAYSEYYPIKINLLSVTRAGATPNTGYVLIRDLRSVLSASVSGDRYVLRTPGSVLTFRAGSRAATFNGQPAALNATPVRLPDTLMFPLKSLTLLGCQSQPLSGMQESRPYRVTCADTSVIVSAVTLVNRNAPAGAVQPDARTASRLRAQELRRSEN